MKVLVLCLIAVSMSYSISHGDWSGRIASDPMTDENIITMSTFNTADLLDAFFFGSAVPEFVIVFREDDYSPLIVVDFNKYIGYGGMVSTCIIRIDDKPAQEYQVLVDNSTKMIGIAIGTADQVEEFYADLLRGSEFRIRFTPAGQAQSTMTFSLSGITALSRELGIDVDYYLNPPTQEPGIAVDNHLKSSAHPVSNHISQRSSPAGRLNTIEIYNIGELSIDEVYIKLSEDESWGENLIPDEMYPSEQSIRPSYRGLFEVPNGFFDFKIVDGTGQEFTEYSIEVTEWYTWTVDTDGVD